MHQQSGKMLLIELFSLAIAIILVIIAFVKGMTFLMLLALFLLFCSTLSNGFLLLYTFRYDDAYKQLARASVLFFLTIWFAVRM